MNEPRSQYNKQTSLTWELRNSSNKQTAFLGSGKEEKDEKEKNKYIEEKLEKVEEEEKYCKKIYTQDNPSLKF